MRILPCTVSKSTPGQERSLAAFLDGQDLRREPFETRKVTLASLLRGIRAGGEA
jgi:hypothetical protein